MPSLIGPAYSEIELICGKILSNFVSNINVSLWYGLHGILVILIVCIVKDLCISNKFNEVATIWLFRC